MSFEICLQEDPEKGNVVISIEINRLSGGRGMTVNSSISIQAGALDKEQQQAGKFGTISISGQKKAEKDEKNPGLMLSGQTDPIEQKKALAKKQAYKIIRDALAGELKRDADVQEVKDHAE